MYMPIDKNHYAGIMYNAYTQLAIYIAIYSKLGHYNEITCFSSTARTPFLSTPFALIILILARDCKNGASVCDSCR